ncbi:hypothetical protein M8C21_026830 [Ambrosia artemisiifolia]|uniref:Uncharacterized protein n=1 Tax=Ambrosia artemisiifolia TaxID=4212 RepID=A0AAD5GM80_AMBAR|nr:hypothetical protein M8C21_026830 [Ambrosia artemisiifolia]
MIKPSHPSLPLSCNLANKSDTSFDGYAFMVHISSSEELIELGWFSSGMSCRTKVKGLNFEMVRCQIFQDKPASRVGTADRSGSLRKWCDRYSTGVATGAAKGVAGSVKNTFGSNQGPRVTKW